MANEVLQQLLAVQLHYAAVAAGSQAISRLEDCPEFCETIERCHASDRYDIVSQELVPIGLSLLRMATQTQRPNQARSVQLIADFLESNLPDTLKRTTEYWKFTQLLATLPPTTAAQGNR